MKIVGLIVEYNPLHNGHIHHINEVKAKSNADLLVAVMSSSFTMRGDLSLFNKFEKTKQALTSGIDLVIELPLVYSIERADIFSDNAVKILNLLNVNEIWIGSENNDLSIYEDYYKKENEIDNKEDYSNSYKNKSNIDLLPNDLLGYFYFKSIKNNNFNIELKTIKRINSNYLDEKPSDKFITSSLSIRNDISLLDEYTPKYVSDNKNNILDENSIFKYLKYRILSSDKCELKEIFFVDEGLENKLETIRNYPDLNSFINSLVSKRYTKTRIKRMLVYILLNIKKNDINEIYSNDIDFIRVLGYSDNGKNYLSEIKKSLNIYTNIKEGINKALDIELKASKILDAIYNNDLFKLEQKGPVKI
ncbi:MAG: nucleotidyltransferase family protein [Acholeplasmatales bacterium]|nr:nucleotidyltransferase family protein [Acholeplasmatales bacterium]